MQSTCQQEYQGALANGTGSPGGHDHRQVQLLSLQCLALERIQESIERMDIYGVHSVIERGVCQAGLRQLTKN